MASRIGKPDTTTDIELRQRLESPECRHFVMVAGAGSGKTTSLIKALNNIAHTQGDELRVRAQKVACITFTDIAVNEIRGDIGTDGLFHVSTIHSFLWSTIKPFQREIKQWIRSKLLRNIEQSQAKIDNPRTRANTRESAARDIARYNQTITALESIHRFTYGTGSNYANGIIGHSDVISLGPYLIREKPLMRRLLAKLYPVIFVDESQDTNPDFVESLSLVAREINRDFCVGFFGDPMQKIYMQGAGDIPLHEGWHKFTKPENFRCPQTVLRLINNIRAEDDQLTQTRGRRERIDEEDVTVEGTVRVLVLPNDTRRQERLDHARQWLAEQDSEPKWLSESDEQTKLLVLVHRQAAEKLNFGRLYSSLNDRSTESLKSGITDGTAWVVRPFLKYVLPLVTAFRESRRFEVIRLIRKFSPSLQIQTTQNIAEILLRLRSDLQQLNEMFSEESTTSIGEAIAFMHRRSLIELDDRYEQLIGEYDTSPTIQTPAPENAPIRFMQCHCVELWGYQRYIEHHSPFATQQGIKGAEFDRVLVVVDDEERQLPGYSYGKYFGVTELSETDIDNIESGNDSVLDRTRRLFYVCCSRALSDLVIAVFAEEPGTMRAEILKKNIFSPESVQLLEIP